MNNGILNPILFPYPLLGKYVECYSLREIWVDADKKLVKSMPHRLSTSIDFYLGDPHKTIEIKNSNLVPYTRCGVRGYRTFSKYNIEIEGKFRSFTVKFKPGGFFGLFGIPMCEFTNQDIPLDLLGLLPTDEILERLSSLHTAFEMREVIEEYLLKSIGTKQNKEVLNFPVHGDQKITELAQNSSKSIRQLERIYKNQVGLSPKSFQNLIRFQKLIELRKENPDENWTQLCFEAQYFDQSHMIKDFKSYLNILPSEFKRDAFAF